MTIYKKPGKTVFASSAKVGEVLDFPDRARGWGVTLDQTNAIPPMEWFNDLQQVNDESIQYLLQYGVAIKDNETEYPVNAITNENGELYICKKQHVNKPVSNPTYWEKIRKEASTSQAGVVELSSSVTSTDETKASTPKAVKTAYDLANTKFDKSGGVINGDVDVFRELRFAKNKETGNYSALIKGDNDAPKMYISKIDKSVFFPLKSGTIVLDRDYSIDKSENGWCKLPNGLIMQWGRPSINGRVGTINFPISFREKCFHVNFIDFANVDQTYILNIGSSAELSKKSFPYVANYAGLGKISFFAIGI